MIKYDYKAKHKNVRQLNDYMLAKTLTMFEWENLPETIPSRELEKLLQTSGYAFITEVNGELYAFNGGLGGEPDVYGNPTTIVISNPALKFNETLNLKTDGVLVLNDDLSLGLIPLYSKFHMLQVENEINLVLNGFNSRMQSFISAGDDRAKASADEFLKKIENGELSAIGDSSLFDSIKHFSASNSSANSITPLIETQQYLKATLMNEVGLSANFNMKRERLTSGEVNQTEDSLFPLVDNLMHNRLKAVNDLNLKYGLSVAVDYGSVWAKKSKENVDDLVNPEPLAKPLDEPLEEPLDESKKEALDEKANNNTVNKSITQEISEVEEILKDDSLSDDERAEWVKLLAELIERQENDA